MTCFDKLRIFIFCCFWVFLPSLLTLLSAWAELILGFHLWPRTWPDYLQLLLTDLFSSHYWSWWLWASRGWIVGLFEFVWTCSLFVCRFPGPVPEPIWSVCLLEWRGVSVSGRRGERVESFLPPFPAPVCIYMHSTFPTNPSLEPWPPCIVTLYIFCTVFIVNKLLNFFPVEAAPESVPSASTTNVRGKLESSTRNKDYFKIYCQRVQAWNCGVCCMWKLRFKLNYSSNHICICNLLLF